MARRRLQILADSQEIHPRRSHVIPDLVEFLRGFTKPDHHARLGKHLIVQRFYLVEQSQRMIIARTRADGRIQARHSFQIVIINVGACRHDHFHGFSGLVAKIRCQNLDGRFWRMFAQFFNDTNELPGTAIGQIIAIDRGDDDMLKPERAGRFGNMRRLKLVDWPGHTGLDVAKSAGARAGIAQDHHRRVLLAPAFADVGAGRFLANGIEVQPPHQRAGFGKHRRGGRPHAQPVWFSHPHIDRRGKG